LANPGSQARAWEREIKPITENLNRKNQSCELTTKAGLSHQL
jgi:hypothetical protein